MTENLISPIYKILLLYEDIHNPKESVTEVEYLKYLDRLYIRYLGYGNQEIYETIKGLSTLGTNISHGSLKSSVFHLIDLIEKGAIDDAV